MQQHVARKLQRNDLIHVPHAGDGVFEVADPDVVSQRIFLKPVPGSGAYARVSLNIALPQAHEFIEQHDGLDHVCGIRLGPSGRLLLFRRVQIARTGHGECFSSPGLKFLTSASAQRIAARKYFVFPVIS